MRAAFCVLAGLTLASAASASAQSCDAILRGGVFDVRESTSSARFVDVMARHTCSTTTSEAGAGLTVPIEGVPFNGSAFQNKKRAACEEYKRNRSLSNESRQFLQTASTAILDAWTSCLGTTRGSRLALKQSVTPKIIRGIVRYTRFGTESPAELFGGITMRGVRIEDCTCETSGDGSTCSVEKNRLAIKVRDGGEQTFLCQRTSPNAVEATLSSTVDQAKEATLPELSMTPWASITPARISSLGTCPARDVAGGSFILRVQDFPKDAVFGLQTRGLRHTDLENLALTREMFPFSRQNFRLAARRRDGGDDGVHLTAGTQSFYLIRQTGDYDCPGDVGWSKIRNFMISLQETSLFD